MSDRFATDSAGRNLAGPARQKRDTMAALPGIALGAAERARAVVPVLLGTVVNAVLHLAADLRAIVAREDDQGVVGQPGAPQCVEHLPDGPIDLDHEVAKLTGPALAQELR